MENNEKLKQYRKDYYEKNKEKIKETSKKNRAKKYKRNPEKTKENKKRWYEKNKEKITQESKKRYKENPEKIQQKNKKWREQNKEKLRISKKQYLEENKEYYKEYYRNYYLENKDKIKEKQSENKDTIRENQKHYSKNRRDSDPLYKITGNLRRMISRAFNRNGYTKESKTFEILGCSFEDFKTYIESKFESWMTWENYGKYNGELNYGWDIDHIIPLSKASTIEELIQLNHFTNLQPLCSKINRDIKIDRITFFEQM